MPLLVILQFWRQPQNVKTIINLTTVSLKGISDDIVVISSAMILGFLVTRTDGIATILTWISADTFPFYVADCHACRYDAGFCSGYSPCYQQHGFIIIIQWSGVRCGTVFIDASPFVGLGDRHNEFYRIIICDHLFNFIQGIRARPSHGCQYDHSLLLCAYGRYSA